MAQTLEQVIQNAGNLVDFVRNQQVGPNVYPGVPSEFSNWRNEQWAWGHTAVLYNQSYHMVDLAVKGPDAFKMLEHLGINSFKNFQPDRAKQFVPVTPDGYVIGDVILFYLDENHFNLVEQVRRRSSGLNTTPLPATGTSPWSVTSAGPCAPMASATPTASRSRAPTR